MPAARGLRQRHGYVQIASQSQHHVGKIVRGQGSLGARSHRLLISGLRLLPIAFGFVELPEQDVEVGIARVILDRLLIGGDGLIHFSLRSLHFTQFDQSIGSFDRAQRTF